MKSATFVKFNFPFDVYAAVINEDAGGNESVTYTKTGSGKGFVIPTGSSIALLTQEALTLGSQVRDLRDTNGNAILVADGESYPVYVYTSEPQLDTFSRIIGYRHSLRREAPSEISDLFSSIV